MLTHESVLERKTRKTLKSLSQRQKDEKAINTLDKGDNPDEEPHKWRPARPVEETPWEAEPILQKEGDPTCHLERC